MCTAYIVRIPFCYNLLMRKRSWSLQQLKKAAEQSHSIRQVLINLKLVPAGGNYVQIKRELEIQEIDTLHFRGKTWNRGLKTPRPPLIATADILVKKSGYQSFKLKKRLFAEGLKKAQCEICGWAERSIDGRLPLELDHVNGDRYDNRIENLRILCPNCHSLQPTHRGRNKGRRGGVIGSRI